MVGVLPGAINSRVCAEAELARGRGRREALGSPAGSRAWAWCRRGLEPAISSARPPLGSERQALVGVDVDGCMWVFALCTPWAGAPGGLCCEGSSWAAGRRTTPV